MIVLADSSPLIALARAHHLELLQEFFGEVVLSREVYKEITVSGEGLPGAGEIRNSSWIRIEDAPSSVPVEIRTACAGLGTGERSLIWLAWSLKADLLLIDEVRARRVATALGFAIAGSVAMLERGALRGYVANLRSLYLDLLRGGIYYSPRLLNQSLARLGLPPLDSEL